MHGLGSNQTKLIYYLLDSNLLILYTVSVGQFEYSVDLSPVMPSDIDRIAKEYKQRKTRDDMIKHEFGMLLLDASTTREDSEAINSFINEQIAKDRQRIIDSLEGLVNNAGYINLAKFEIINIVNDQRSETK